jgi:hypothetical protein
MDMLQRCRDVVGVGKGLKLGERRDAAKIRKS